MKGAAAECSIQAVQHTVVYFSSLLRINGRPGITAAMVNLSRAEKDLARLQKNVDTRVEALQRELGERHAAFTVPASRPRAAVTDWTAH